MNRAVPVAMVVALLLSGGRAAAEAIELANDRAAIAVNLIGGLPGRWEACVPGCEVAGHRAVQLLRATEDGGRLAWLVPGDDAATRRLDNLEYAAGVRRNDAGALLILQSIEPFQGIRLVHRYFLAKGSAVLQISLQVPAGATLQLSAGADLLPERLPGFGSIYTDVRAVLVASRGQTPLVSDGDAGMSVRAEPDEWVGVRSRFWALLLEPAIAIDVEARESLPDRPSITTGAVGVGRLLDLEVYGGPIDPGSLTAVSPTLGRMLYAGLWDWLRLLATGLRLLLDGWFGIVGSYGLAIVLLSLTVKVLMFPLTWVAERWQDDVNRTQTLLAGELAEIRRNHKGEDAHNRILATYARHGVSPWYTLKSLAGFLIQIPIFIAAFDMLGEHFGLAGQRFLWIADLSLPDRLATLPVTVPFFGADLNLLPFVMTALTIVAALLQRDDSLSAELGARQRLRLYAMAALFLVLLYTFPAGMVLYWTANNFWHLVKIGGLRLLPRRAVPTAG